MTHRDVIPLLSDLLSNQIGEPDATAAWTHVASCIECRQAVTAMHEVRAAVARGGAQVFEAHPTSRDIVLFALNDPALADDERKRIEAHLVDCSSCSDEVLITRRAEAATRSGGGPISITGLGAWLAPALAAVIVALAFPAFNGLVRYPNLVREHDEVGRELEGLRAELSERVEESAAREPGGPVRVLFLPATTRGDRPLPVVERLPGQVWQPIIIQHRAFTSASPAGQASVVVTRERDASIVWSDRVSLVQAWDWRLEALTLMVPATGLDPGSYRIVLDGYGIVGYEARFEVRTGER